MNQLSSKLLKQAPQEYVPRSVAKVPTTSPASMTWSS
jgi:hypothetical protein